MANMSKLLKVRNLDLNYAQFVLVLVLDAGSKLDRDAAIKVRSFLDPNPKYNKVTKTKEINVALSKQIVRKRDNLYLDLLYEANINNSSFLYEFINYVYNYKVLESDKLRSGATTSLCSLQDLNISKGLKKLYDECIFRLLNKEALLIQYMRSEMFFEQFRKKVRLSYGKDVFKGTNNLTDSRCRALLEPFIYYVSSYSEQGFCDKIFDTDNYIFNIFNEYFKPKQLREGSKEVVVANEFIEILNGRGIDAEKVYEDGSTTTGYMQIEIDPSRKHANIDFKDIANKIYIASMQVYRSSQRDSAFYDIFSRFRDELYKENFTRMSPKDRVNYKDYLNEKCIDLVNALESKLLNGCRFIKYTPDYSFTYCNNNSANSIKNKLYKRKEFLNSFDKIIEYGKLYLSEIKDTYDEQLRINDSQRARDDNTIYNSKTQNKKGCVVNSTRFRDLYNGFVALKRFLDFIYSDDNVYGITVNNFDVTIFRNPNLLRNVHDLEAYIRYGKITLKLIESEMDSNSQSIALNLNGMTGDNLAKMKQIEMFNLMKKTNLPVIKDIQMLQNGQKDRSYKMQNALHIFYNHVNSYNSNISFFTIFDKKFKCPTDVINKVLKQLDYSIWKNEKYKGIRESMENSIKIMILLYKKKDSINVFNPKIFKSALEFLSAIECLMAIDGTPMLDFDKCYSYVDEMRVLDYIDGVEDHYVTKQGDYNFQVFDKGLRKTLIDFIFSEFFKDSSVDRKKYGDNFENLPYFHKLRILFSINNFLLCFIDDMSDLSEKLLNYTNDVHETYLNICGKIQLTNLHADDFSMDELYSLYDKESLFYAAGSKFSLVDAKDFREIIETFTFDYFSRAFMRNKRYNDLLNYLYEETCNAFESKGTISIDNMNAISHDFYVKLSVISFDIVKRKNNNPNDSIFTTNINMLNSLKMLAEIKNSFNFFTIGGKVWKSREDFYIHSLGVQVKIIDGALESRNGNLDYTYELEPLTSTVAKEYTLAQDMAIGR